MSTISEMLNPFEPVDPGFDDLAGSDFLRQGPTDFQLGNIQGPEATLAGAGPRIYTIFSPCQVSRRSDAKCRRRYTMKKKLMPYVRCTYDIRMDDGQLGHQICSA